MTPAHNIYCAGYVASRDGQPIYTCPYAIGRMARRIWLRGWRAAKGG